jgi:hypothetical protein
MWRERSLSTPIHILVVVDSGVGPDPGAAPAEEGGTQRWVEIPWRLARTDPSMARWEKGPLVERAERGV